jgi:murein DD-endopeptidase MepM/ murein hydrolase activator NlpD
MPGKMPAASGPAALCLTVLSGMAALWAMAAPAQPMPFTPAALPEVLARTEGPETDLGSELALLYAQAEGPADLRFGGSDTHSLILAEGDTLAGILRDAGTSAADAEAAAAALKGVFDLRQLREGDRVTLTFGHPGGEIRAGSSGADPDGGRVRLMALAFKPDVEREITVSRTASGLFEADIRRAELAAQLYRASGVIESSLYMSAAASGVPGIVVDRLAEAFTYEVDFQRDIKPGDGFEVFFTRYYDEAGRPVKAGDILYAELRLGETRKVLYRHSRGPGEAAEYFDEEGRSTRRALLKTPIQAARVSSGFGMRRHPILGYSKMHRGIDFAAPTGTPVRASGAGTIEIAGVNGGYGNYVRIRHTGRYSTAYAHLNTIERGIREGTKVAQGQLIGTVGSTGLSTGPHLHYEILIDGEQVDPAAVKIDMSEPLKGKSLSAFEKTKRAIDSLMAATPLNAPVEGGPAVQLVNDMRGARQ